MSSLYREVSRALLEPGLQPNKPVQPEVAYVRTGAGDLDDRPNNNRKLFITTITVLPS